MERERSFSFISLLNALSRPHQIEWRRRDRRHCFRAASAFWPVASIVCYSRLFFFPHSASCVCVCVRFVSGRLPPAGRPHSLTHNRNEQDTHDTGTNASTGFSLTWRRRRRQAGPERWLRPTRRTLGKGHPASGVRVSAAGRPLARAACADCVKPIRCPAAALAT
jgi:hypothetical protein